MLEVDLGDALGVAVSVGGAEVAADAGPGPPRLGNVRLRVVAQGCPCAAHRGPADWPGYLCAAERSIGADVARGACATAGSAGLAVATVRKGSE